MYQKWLINNGFNFRGKGGGEGRGGKGRRGGGKRGVKF
jgi:hypothetical protein